MAVDVNQLAEQDQAFLKQAADARAAKQTQDTFQGGQQQEPSFASKFMTDVGRVGLNTIDWAVNAAHTIGSRPDVRYIRDAQAGVITAAANTADAVGSALNTSGRRMAAAEDPEHADAALDESAQLPTSPIWDHAHSAIMDFRDAVAVKDPTISDGLVQSAAQLAIPFAGYSRLLSGVHGFANVVAAGALTDATALEPHATRMADLVALGKHTEGKLGDTLRRIAPDGSAFNSYLNFLASNPNDSEAEARFKNVLDGFTTNLIMTPMLHAAGVVLKQGTAGLRYAIDNGVGSAGDLMPANQEGKIVFHGTAADFDRFSNDKVGSGEGNATFGYGAAYLAEDPGVAGHYQQMLARRNIPAGSPMFTAMGALNSSGGDTRVAYKKLMDTAKLSNTSQPVSPDAAAHFTKAADLIRNGNVKGGGNLMHVEVDDKHIANMWDWDEPIGQQPKLEKAVESLDVKVQPENGKFRVMVNDKPGPLYLTRGAAMSDTDLLRGQGRSQSAGMLYQQLAEVLRSPKAASEFLASKGFPGHTFLDGTSRANGQGTKNIVLYDAEKHATIVGKNGKVFEGKKLTDMSLSPEERALERERVAAQRAREEGLEREPEIEPIPPNAARREGAAAQRRAE